VQVRQRYCQPGRERTMRKNYIANLFALVALVASSAAVGQQNNLAADCATEIKTYCANVTPGSDRIVACLIAYEDKIPARCRLTAYMGSDELGIRMQALKQLAKTCSSDILQYCSKVSAGGGRIYDCLAKNKATLTDACRAQVPAAQQYMKD
jgi:hypothetical protein